MYLSKNPFTGIVEKEFDVITNEQLQTQLELSQQAFNSWKNTPYSTRSKLLFKMADLLEERADQYGRLISTEMGKPIKQSVGEVEKCAWVCRYYAESGADFLNARILESTAVESQLIYEPMGTIFAVMPWNFPFWQVFRFIAPCIMAGNVGLLKHASNVPRCALAIEQVFIDADAPQGLFRNLFINHQQVELEIASPIVKAITMTGSNKTGSIIASIAGKYAKKTVLELGGSDAFIVFDDADMHSALQQALLSRFLNSGQSCIAAKRFIVHESIADEFVTNFQSLIENLVKGNPLDSETFIGPLVNEMAMKDLEAQVTTSISLGAKCLVGGEVCEFMRSVYEPTLLYDVPMESQAWTDELFGPVAVVRFFDSDEEAIALANDSQFGLGASIWTTDMDRAAWISQQLQVGTVAINGMVKTEPGLPFGGTNQSGYGRELGELGLHEFMNIKTVSYF
ncbi:MAG: NAD-dependent succinate-semialdehyde dehydrogenase [Salinivirgaceae bacterium]